MEDADGKAAGVFPPVVAAALAHAMRQGVPDVPWILPPDPKQFEADVQRLLQAIMDFKQ